MVFRILQNGVRTDLKAFDAALPVQPQEIWDDFMGAPSVYFVFSVPQDGIAAPADFNASASSYLRSLWNGTATGTSAGTLTGPDADGYYTATLTGVTIPASAKMLTGGLGYSYSVITTLPLTQTNLANYPVTPATATSGLTATMPNKTGGLIVIAPNAQKVATNFTARRPIVEDKRCNACHQELGTFTEEAFHAGQRNDGTTCAWCHTPNRTSSGWSADSTSFVHAIHAGNKRDGAVHLACVEHDRVVCRHQVPRRAEGLRDLPPARDLQLQRHRVGQCLAEQAVPDRGHRHLQRHRGYADHRLHRLGDQQLPGHGPQRVFAVALHRRRQHDQLRRRIRLQCGDGRDRPPPRRRRWSTRRSPAACFACHDSTIARAHIEYGGGSIYAPRSTALGTTETCMVCHDAGRIADIKVMHAK